MEAHSNHVDVSPRESGDSENGKAAILTAIQARAGAYDALMHSATHSGSEPRSTRRAYLDVELSTIDAALAELRRRRNLLSPASGCPPEVLSNIFRHCMELEPNHYPDPKDYVGSITGELCPRLGWMKVVQVCSSWRRAAHADGRLWTTVTTSLGARWTAEMMRLSKGLPVYWDLHLPTTLSMDQISPLSLLRDSASRMYGLRILYDGSDPTYRARQQQQSLHHLPTPALESLIIYLRDSPFLPFNGMFRDKAPKLQTLYVHNAELPRQLMGRQLTELTLLMDDKYRIFFEAREFVRLLRELPNLASLCIKNHTFGVNDRDEEANSQDEMVAQCPNLTSVTLHLENIAGSLFIFNHLATNTSAQVSLAGHYHPDHPDPAAPAQQDAAIARFAERMATNPICADMRTVEWRSYGVAHTPIREEADRVDRVYERTLTLSAWRANRHGYLLADYAGYKSPPPPDLKITLGFRAYQPELDPEDILPWPQPFPSALNVSLQTTGRRRFTVGSWSDVLSSFPQLKWLRVDRELAEYFLKNLNEEFGPSFPRSIKTLALLGVFWGTDEDDKLEELSTDQMLANVWTEAQESDGALENVIVGDVLSCSGDWQACIDEAGVAFEFVKRPEWMDESHEDWDDRTDW
ncbi:unnamed protein product [Peniophora sp. CBMAI 1063]|nr:unnamed protein product [Peniophora sp. CBMAI 1063]